MKRFATRLIAAHSFGRLLGVFLIFLSGLSERTALAQYSLIHGFAGAPNDGSGPEGSLTTDGTILYGFTFNGGSTNKGTVFKVNTNKTGYQVLHSFTGLSLADIILGHPGNTNDGANPAGTPLLIGGTLYGLTSIGGTNGVGTVFSINTDGTGFQLLHHFGSFSPPDGQTPLGSLVTDGTNLFGMTSASTSFEGTIFTIGTNGSGYHILHNFAVGGTDGLAPQGSLLFSDGVLYGMTQRGGQATEGTIFRINSDGTGYQKLHDFGLAANDGGLPYGSLIVSGSTLYGMTSAGGSNNVGAVFGVDTSGTNFQVLHSFSLSELSGPKGDLTLSNSTLYGMAFDGGTNGLGLGGVFQVNTDGSAYRFVHVFSFAPAPPKNAADGSDPFGSLLLLNSQLYGMTFFGGSDANAGTLFLLAGNSGGGGGGGGAVGGLKVNIVPAAAVSAGAEWQADFGSFFKSGVTVTNLSAGEHFISFKAVAGFSTPADQIAAVTLGTTNIITGTYTAADTTKPTLKVTTPTAGMLVSNAVFTASGTANDNVAVAGVYYQLNGGSWTPANTANSWSNWSAPDLNLIPGTNRMSFYARDTSANLSATDTVSFTFVVTAQLVVNVNGAGTIKPNLNQASLQLGKKYSMTAEADKGSVFVDWEGSFFTNAAKLTFMMASNLEFTAHFKDITRPVNVILSPKKNQIVTNPAPVATGKAKDNVGVAAVQFRVDGGSWMPANLPDGTNWTTPSLLAMLLSGPNSISAFAQDAAGNASLTNTVNFKYMIQPGADWAPDSLNGLLASVTPAAGPPESVGFDLTTCAQTGATNDTESEDFGAGSYEYVKTDTNMAQLSMTFTNPPGSTNDLDPITLVFTNHYAGYFTNGDSGETGGFSAAIATDFIPATIIGKTFTGTSASSGKIASVKLGTGTFVKTPANNSNSGTSSGNYTFRRYSPDCGMLALVFTDPADSGQSAYVLATFTSATGGMYFITTFDSLGTLQGTDTGRFTLK